MKGTENGNRRTTIYPPRRLWRNRVALRRPSFERRRSRPGLRRLRRGGLRPRAGPVPFAKTKKSATPSQRSQHDLFKVRRRTGDRRRFHGHLLEQHFVPVTQDMIDQLETRIDDLQARTAVAACIHRSRRLTRIGGPRSCTRIRQEGRATGSRSRTVRPAGESRSAAVPQPACRLFVHAGPARGPPRCRSKS